MFFLFKYLIQFKIQQIETLINYRNKLNTISSTLRARLGLTTPQISFNVQKIDSFVFKIYSMVIERFLIENKSSKISFLDKTFLLADTSIEVVLRMIFIALNNRNI